MDGGISAAAQSPRAKVDVPAIIQRYVDGESLQDIAAECNVHRSIIYRWMFSELGEAYPAVVTAALINRMAEADEELDVARDPVDIARAREKARFARMDLERRRPMLYGPKQQVDMRVTTTDLGDRLRAAQERVIEGEVVAGAQHHALQHSK